MPKTTLSLPKLMASCMMGNALEWFDFALYGYFAGVIGRVIFPAGTDASVLLKSYFVFFLGFVMRPLGALVFGYIGDRYGRQKALMWAIYCMAIPTALMGLLPPYAWVGSFSAIMLILLRMFQGLSMGGEFTGSMIVVVENAPDHQKGWWGSWTTVSVAVGLLLGCGSGLLLSTLLSNAQLESWGWRIPFVASLGGSWLGMVLRKSMSSVTHEPKPSQTKEEVGGEENFSASTTSTGVIKTLFKDHWRAVVHVFCVDIVVAIGFFLVTIYAGHYAQKYGGLSFAQASQINTICLIFFGLSVLVAGRWSDRIGWAQTLKGGIVALTTASVPCFYGLKSGWGMSWVLMAQGLLSVLMGIVFAPIPAYVVSMFPAKVRYSGVSIAHNLSMTIFGGSAMWVATFFIEKTHYVIIPGFYLMGACLVSYGVLQWGFLRSKS